MKLLHQRIHTLNAQGITHIISLLLVVVGAGIIGSAAVVASHAQTPTVTLNANAASTYVGKNVAILTSADAQGPTPAAPSTVPLSFIGSQTVNYLAPGESLSYDQGIKGDVVACYLVYVPEPKAGEATVKVEFANNNNYTTVSLFSNPNNTLQQVCVNPGTKTNPGFSVKNVTSVKQVADVEVYEAILRW